LLAEVYVRLTRGQHSLLGEERSAQDTNVDEVLEAFDFGALNLSVLQASEAERAAHDKLLVGLDKDAGGRCLWRDLPAVA
jgi:DNA polymerase-3 subunit epsilon